MSASNADIPFWDQICLSWSVHATADATLSEGGVKPLQLVKGAGQPAFFTQSLHASVCPPMHASLQCARVHSKRSPKQLEQLSV
mmetsp:Transcript_24871/g.43743  ORF Transcript_24871/g.43743 Transcript_24871/m.43743 type:complete len:84 (+) Transcript_24871:185-436(+)